MAIYQYYWTGYQKNAQIGLKSKMLFHSIRFEKLFWHLHDLKPKIQCLTIIWLEFHVRAFSHTTWICCDYNLYTNSHLVWFGGCFQITHYLFDIRIKFGYFGHQMDQIGSFWYQNQNLIFTIVLMVAIASSSTTSTIYIRISKHWNIIYSNVA